MKSHKILLCVLLFLTLSVTAYAGRAFTMTYNPGAEGVTNMPDNDGGAGGQFYTAASAVPQREGYEFLGWQLDWGEEEPPAQTASYTVRYVNEFGEDIAEWKTVDVTAGETITEYPVPIDGFFPLSDRITWVVQDGDIQVFIYYEKRIW